MCGGHLLQNIERRACVCIPFLTTAVSWRSMTGARGIVLIHWHFFNSARRAEPQPDSVLPESEWNYGPLSGPCSDTSLSLFSPRCKHWPIRHFARPVLINKKRKKKKMLSRNAFREIPAPLPTKAPRRRVHIDAGDGSRSHLAAALSVRPLGRGDNNTAGIGVGRVAGSSVGSAGEASRSRSRRRVRVRRKYGPVRLGSGVGRGDRLRSAIAGTHTRHAASSFGASRSSAAFRSFVTAGGRFGRSNCRPRGDRRENG